MPADWTSMEAALPLGAGLIAAMLENPQFQLILRVALGLIPAFIGVYLMLPRGERGDGKAARYLGGALVTATLVLLTTFPVPTVGAPAGGGAVEPTAATLLLGLPEAAACYTFHALAFVSVAGAVMMITSRNPVYSALWFAMVLLGNSALYMLQGAEFLAAATVIVYAGAIVVTFLFVVMLAQPNGAARYDRMTREPLLASLTGLLLGSVLLAGIHQALQGEGRPAVSEQPGRPAAVVVGNVAAESSAARLGADAHVKGLGKTLFLDHVVSVEITGVLLLAAVVGAVLIAGHRIEESHVRK